jgi:hypothetical protein
MPGRQAWGMAFAIVFAVLILACVLSILVPDDRDYDVNDRRGWWPGHRS